SNLKTAIGNVADQYEPGIIGIASTCLSETIGEDIDMMLGEFKRDGLAENWPPLVYVSTPSYSGSHRDGFWNCIGAILKSLTTDGGEDSFVKPFVLTPGMVSPSDLRHMKRLFKLYDYPLILMGDYSQTMDGGTWKKFQKISPGGTTQEEISRTPKALCALDFTVPWNEGGSRVLSEEYGVEHTTLPLPIGIAQSDALHKFLREKLGREIPEEIVETRSRLLDAYTDAHKYCFGKKALIYGEPELVRSLAVFLEEFGIVPRLCATGSSDKRFGPYIEEGLEHPELCEVLLDQDFDDMANLTEINDVDLIIGNGKGFKLAEKLGVPLIRVGFPIHDRFGGSRVSLLDYEGTFQLFDRIVNALLEVKQKKSKVGYTYL
ncbi:MAG: nitrogenase component 1, partial [Spirochaetales bacterium]|nr:nitrogenase component 1 [Spirochaetales bacterium]